jgi:hypothetical protein
MNEKEIKALAKEAKLAAQRYKAALNAKNPKPKKSTPRGGRGMGGGMLGGGGSRGPVIK